MTNVVLGQLLKISTMAGSKLVKRIFDEPLVQRAINATAEQFEDYGSCACTPEMVHT